MFVVYYTYSHAMSCHADVPTVGFFSPCYSPYPASLNVKQHQSHQFSWFVVRILTFPMQTPAPQKKTFNSHCILQFCIHYIHFVPFLPGPLAPPLAPPWLPACAPLMRSKLTASQRSSSSSSWSWHSSRAREAAASAWSSGDGSVAP